MEAKGIGLSFRTPFLKDIDLIREDLDFLEVVTEKYYLEKNKEELNYLSNNFPIFPHSLSLSIGTTGDLSEKKLDNISEFVRSTNASCFSDHLAISKAADIELLDFLPIAFTEESLQNISKKVDIFINRVNKPLYLENITYILNWPNHEYTEIEFWTKLLNSSNVGMLFDVTNLYINAYNHKYDPYEFIDRLPTEKVHYLHVSGCTKSKNKDMLVDSHSQPINKEVWKLLEYTKKKMPIKGVILERDLNFNNYQDIAEDIRGLKELFKGVISV
jgi:uncharacterized protein